MNRLPEHERKELEYIESTYYQAIERMANRAVRRCVARLRRRFPKRRFVFRFDNGSAFYSVDGKQISVFWKFWNPTESVVWEPGTTRGKIIPSSWSVDVDGASVNPLLFEEICVLEDELMEITDGFSRGCPDNVDTGDM